MKKIVLVLSLSFAFSSVSFANKSDNVKAHKTHVLTQLDKKISLLKSHKSCVSSAKKKEDIQKCRSSHKEKMEAFQADKKAAKSAMKAKRRSKKKI